RMETDRTSFHQRRLKCLYSQTVECRCTVEQYRVFLDDIFKNVPYFILHTFDLSFGIFDIRRILTFNKLFHDYRFEEVDRQFPRQTALLHLERRAYDDNRTAGIVDTLTEQILTETSLLTFEHVSEGFERTIARSCHRTATAAVID